MVESREILRLDHEGQYQRQITASIVSSQNTVSDVLPVAKAAGIERPLEKELTNEACARSYSPERFFPRVSI